MKTSRGKMLVAAILNKQREHNQHSLDDHVEGSGHNSSPGCTERPVGLERQTNVDRFDTNGCETDMRECVTPELTELLNVAPQKLLTTTLHAITPHDTDGCETDMRECVTPELTELLNVASQKLLTTTLPAITSHDTDGQTVLPGLARNSDETNKQNVSNQMLLNENLSESDVTIGSMVQDSDEDATLYFSHLKRSYIKRQVVVPETSASETEDIDITDSYLPDNTDFNNPRFPSELFLQQADNNLDRNSTSANVDGNNNLDRKSTSENVDGINNLDHNSTSANVDGSNNISSEAVLLQSNNNLPQATDLTRKRKKNPEKWKRNSQKILRMEGKEYLSRSGKIKKAKVVRDINCKCHYKCTTKIEKSQRIQMLADYLSLESERSRWAFINSRVKRIPVKRRYSGTNNKRQRTLQYTVMNDGNEIQVCKQFFLATYDISGKKVETALKKLTSAGVTEIDHRGHKEPPNKKSEDVKNIIRDHIKLLPVVSSHYCRSTTKRKYLPSGLSENRIYLDYVEYCKSVDVIPEKFSLYKHIFVTEFNYGFHRPKKDQCDYCTQHKNKSDEEKAINEEEYNLHLIRAEEAREHKKLDKAQAKCDPNVSSFCMDLEKILLTPSLQVGQLYYLKKLKTYNFTIYNLADKQGTNYMWHEGDGTKGASEIASCLWKLLVSLGSKTEVTFYSDTASGQNRNCVISSMFLRAVENLPIDCINQKFMESGHSEMECDSVHSTIEARGRQVDVFTPEGWYMVARTAKTSKPYHNVVEMQHSDFLNYKLYSAQVMTNKTQSQKGSKMKWLKVKWFQYRKTEPTTVYYKYRLSDNDFESLPIQRRSLRKTCIEIPKLYSIKPKIDRSKLKDLLKMCQKGIIRQIYHDFYKKLEGVDDLAQENFSSCEEENTEE